MVVVSALNETTVKIYGKWCKPTKLVYTHFAQTVRGTFFFLSQICCVLMSSA